MNKEYWASRWRKNEIGFHGDEVNPWLLAHHARAAGRSGSRVLVPLAGKSRDMAFLEGEGYEVVGIEFVQEALEAFFDENGIPHLVKREGERTIFEGERIKCLASDFFDVRTEDIEPCHWAYDRAAIVVFEGAERTKYVAHLRSFLREHARVLLIAFHYDQAEMKGPPYSVSPDGVQEAYRDARSIEMLGEISVLDEKWKKRGLTWAKEEAWLIEL